MADAVAASGAVAFEVIDEDVKQIAIAIKKVQTSWKRWLGFAVAVGTIVGAILGAVVWLGGKNLSPAERFEEHDEMMRASVRTIRAEVDTMERTIRGQVDALETRTRNVEDAVDLMSYLLCVQIRRADPNSVPPRCNDPSIRRLAPR